MTRKIARLDPDQLEGIHAVRHVQKMEREELITANRRSMQRANQDHMEVILDQIEDFGVDVILTPIVQQMTRTMGNKVVTFHTKISANPH